MLYTIEDKTLKAMGDAIRSYTGVLIETTTEAPEPFWSYDIEISGADMSGWTESTSSYSYVVVIPQKEILGDCWDVAKYLEYSFIYDNTDSNNATDISIKMYTDETYASGSYSTPIVSSNKYYSPLPYSDTGRTLIGNIKNNGWWELRFNVPKRNFTTTDTITFHLDLWVMSSSTEYVTPKKYTPLEMIDEVYGIIDDFANAPTIPEEALNLTGNCQYRFANGGWDWFIENYKDKITTNNLASAYFMFSDSRLSEIPFDLKFDSSYNSLSAIFRYCINLKEVPKLYIKPGDMDSMFEGCWNLKYIPEDWCDNWDWSYMDGLTSSYYGYRRNLFYNCYSLRSYPTSIFQHGNPYISNSQSIYYNIFYSCYSLDEVVDLPFPHYNASWTSNAFTSSFYHTKRLKKLTFALQENGTPYVMKWKNQTIDLSYYVGYTNSINDILNYNSGITADKRVKDDATYQALKDDPDWFTLDINYSRYNHDSAVATINSLPDCSAYGTNTIKFTGAAGALTDGGAINTLTEEEIAVAAAKGWTVSLV